MAEVSLKRVRDEVIEATPLQEFESDPKKQKSFNQILSILDQDEDEPDHDLSSLMSSLENEISCTFEFDSLKAVAESDGVESKSEGDENDEKEKVIRHLLEASDDELGLPASTSTNETVDGVVIDGGDSFGFCEGLWELEDEAANYYTLLQSELFM